MDQFVNFIIRPPRSEYSLEHDLLDQEFMLKGKWYHRNDIEIKNSRGNILQCSHYTPLAGPEGKLLPCVIYCHGNSGCRADACEAAIILLPLNITVFTLDFSGSGLSGGEHVTLGWNEKDDLKAVVDYLRSDGNVSMIGLWGRSMGAVTSLMYGSEDPSIAGMVLDSPFSDLVDLMMELADTQVRIPKFTVKFVIYYMRRAIMKKANFDIMELNAIKVAKSCFVPVLFGHAIDDDFIQPHHSERIFDVYMGDKNIIKFDGDHNSPRPQFYFDSISIFFNNVLQPPEDDAPVIVSSLDPVHEYMNKATWNALHGLGFSGSDSSVGFRDTARSGAGDAIEQFRSKRSMRRMQDDTVGTESSSSNYGMISFDRANGQPFGPHVPVPIDDDQFMEYPLDTMVEFPHDLEEEERMVMEAIVESLKDVGPKQIPDEEPSSCTISDAFPVDEECKATTPVDIEKGDCGLSKTNSTVLSSTNTDALASQCSAPYTEGYTSETQSDKSFMDSSTVSGSKNDTPGQAMEPSGKESGDGIIEKSSSGHIMDGFLRRWDLGFFKSSQ